MCSLLLDFIPGIFRAIFESLILLTFRVCIPHLSPSPQPSCNKSNWKKKQNKKTKAKTKTKKASGNFCKKILTAAKYTIDVLAHWAENFLLYRKIYYKHEKCKRACDLETAMRTVCENENPLE